MSSRPGLDAQLHELVERTYRSLEDQLYDPKPEVDGYDKDRQREYVLGLLTDLAHDAVSIALSSERSEA